MLYLSYVIQRNNIKNILLEHSCKLVNIFSYNIIIVWLYLFEYIIVLKYLSNDYGTTYKIQNNNEYRKKKLNISLVCQNYNEVWILIAFSFNFNLLILITIILTFKLITLFICLYYIITLYFEYFIQCVCIIFSFI